MIFKKREKKKMYDFGDFITNDPNDFGIAKFYYNRCIELEKKNLEQFKEICKLKQELELRTKRMIITDLEVRDI